MERIPLVLDMDTGIDDAVALTYALLNERAQVLAVGSVHGNVEAELAAENSLRVLELLGREDVPVAVGAGQPVAQPLATARFIHGDDGLGNTALPPPRRKPSSEHAVDQLIRLAHERPGEITLVATGPLTNLGLALLKDPELPALLRRVVIMGGAVGCAGNITATAEANIWHDPEAADLVFRAGWPLTMVGLDVTMTVLMGPAQRQRLSRLSARQPVAGWLDRMLDFYVRAYESVLGEPVCPVHDPLAVAAALDEGVIQCQEWPVRVELRGEWTRGMTVADRRGLAAGGEALASLSAPLTRVAVRADTARFFDGFFAALSGGGEDREGSHA
ncbi:MAG: nucleoside hydrolase [Sphaerobacter sp.]|nr:nucleoside hydrolase [Sphaerobacter sp.]